jgi:hypothetical protein
MPLDAAALRERLRRRAFHRLEAGCRVGSDWLVEVMKNVVDRPSHGADLRGPVAEGVFEWHPQAFRFGADEKGEYTYGSPLGPTRRRRGGGTYRMGAPPYMRTGAGMRSICFEIIERDITEGRLVIRFGTDASARSAAAPYMLMHEKGINYPTIGPAKGSGPKLIRPWLRPTVRRYYIEFTSLIIAVARGLL